MPANRPSPLAKYLLIPLALLSGAATRWEPIFTAPQELSLLIKETPPREIAVGLTGALAFAAVVFAMAYHAFFIRRARLRVSLALSGILFALTHLVGRSYNHFDSLSGLIGTPFQAGSALFAGAGFGLFYIALLTEAFLLLQKSAALPQKAACAFSDSWLGRATWAPMTVIFLGWLPYLIAFYPGSMEWDYLVQIGVYDGIYLRSNAHPYLVTLLMGGQLEFGRQLGSDNLGAFLYILLQSPMLSFAFARTVRLAAKWGLSKAWGRTLTAFYAFFPLWGFFAQFGIKDVLYTGLATLFVSLIWQYVLYGEAFRKNPLYLALLFIVSILVALTRNNGIILVFPTLLFLALLKGKRSAKAGAAGTALAVLGAYIFWLGAALPAMGVVAGSPGEALSIPFQQTARCLRDHPKDVTPQEAQAISELLDYENLGALYMSARSDSVKATLNPSATPAQWRAYFSAWGSMLLRHPRTYLESFLSNSYAYYSTDAVLPYLPLCEFNTAPEKNPVVYLGNVDLNQIESLSGMREVLKRLYQAIKRTPLLSLLINQGFYSLATFSLAVLLYNLKRRDLVIGLLPALMVIMPCVASPVNGMMRYSLPVMAFFPVSVCAIRAGMAPSRAPLPPCGNL